MKKSESILSAAARKFANVKTPRSSLMLCLCGGMLAWWAYFIIAQLGAPAASAIRPTGALAISKRLALLPMTHLGFTVTHFRQHLVVFFLVILVQFFILGMVIGRLARHQFQSEISTGTHPRPLAGVIFIFAVLFRLTLLPQTPWLSDDIYRYLWDGRVLANGINPFHYSPAAVELAHLRDAEIFPHINHKDIATVYPPLLQALFWLANQLGGSIIAMKTVLVVADLALVVLLIWALPKLELPSWWAILYAWHPLAIIEIAGSGHADGIGALFLFTAVIFLTRRRHEMIAVGCLALAFLVKFLSVLLVPFLFWREQATNANWRRLFNKPNRRLFFLFVVITFFSYLPFAGSNLLSGLMVYAAKWRFNDSIFALFYTPIHALLPDGLVMKLMVPPQWEITQEVLTTRRVDLALLITKILMAAILFGFIIMSLNKIRETNDRPNLWLPFAVFSSPLSWPALALNVLGMFFLLSPTVQPWYLLWILPLLCIVRQPGWIMWSATVFLAYWILEGYARTGLWQESAWVKWAEYGTAGGVAIMARVWKAQQKTKSPHPNSIA